MGHQLAIRFCHHETFLINERYLRPGFAAGPLAVPGPVPIVSPVVPLFIAPLLIPVPGLRRPAPFAELLLWLGVAGEIAESPVVGTHTGKAAGLSQARERWRVYDVAREVQAAC